MTEAKRIANIEAASNLDVTFSVTRKDAGTYSVMVGGFGGSFTVVVPALVVPPVEEEVPEAPVPAQAPEEEIGRTALTWIKDKVLLPGGGVN